jgi:hypothetical protein
VADPVTGRVGLETSGGVTTNGRVTHPRFFTGFVAGAEPAAIGLLAVANVAGARYYNPQLSALRDPVVTCGGDRLRFESFSGCCGVYARLDLLPGALEGEVIDRGTTNVDVNGPLREALAGGGGGDPLRLEVGPDELAVTTLDRRDGRMAGPAGPAGLELPAGPRGADGGGPGGAPGP